MSDTELHHLLNRAIDGVVLHGESDRLRELVRELEADRDRVHERACRLAERLRKAEAEREQLRTTARTHWDTTERVRDLADRWALPGHISMPAAANDIRAALDQPQQPTTPAVPCSLAVLKRPHEAHAWQPQPGMNTVYCPGPEQQPTTTEACTCKHPIGEHSIYGCTDECACEWMPKSPTAVLLATDCDACDHTLNWHSNYAGCTVPRCVCGQFQQPTA